MFIEIEVNYQYGNKVFYPVCKQAKLFAQIAGTKTLKYSTLDLIEKMGYEIKIIELKNTWKN
jgi:hypothetical protein